MSKVMLDCGSSASLYDVIGLEKVHRPFNQSDEKTKTNHDAWAWSLWFLTCFILWYDFATFKVEKCLWKKCKPFMRRILLLIFFCRLWNENNEIGLSTGFLFCDLKIFVFFRRNWSTILPSAQTMSMSTHVLLRNTSKVQMLSLPRRCDATAGLKRREAAQIGNRSRLLLSAQTSKWFGF